MASKVEICNLALQNIGEEYITSLSESTPNAIECNLRFDTVRRSLLAMHPWNFAMKRVALSASTTAPAFTYTYSYPLPADFLMMVMTEQQELSQGNFYTLPDPNKVSVGDSFLADKYTIEDGNLLSNSSGVKILYVFDQTDTSQYSGPFVNLLSYYLAAHIAYRIKGDGNLQQSLMSVFETKLREFKTLDSQQGVPTRIKRSNWLAARQTGYY